MIQFKYFCFFLLVPLTLLICACGNDKKDQNVNVNSEIQKLKLQQNQTIRKNKIMEDIALPKPVVYRPRKPISNVPMRQEDGSVVPVNPLTAYAISEYKFVGVVIKDNHTSAYLLSPDGTLNVVNVGDTIGTERAKISNVTPTEIQITQIENNENNQPIEKTSAIYLKDKQNE